jgi:hypothetical protein
MSPAGPKRNIEVPSNIYTAWIGLACALVLFTFAFVAYVCYNQYGTFYEIP